jgi:hypothetical protein
MMVVGSGAEPDGRGYRLGSGLRLICYFLLKMITLQIQGIVQKRSYKGVLLRMWWPI